MLSEGDVCLVTAGEIAGSQVVLECRINPGKKIMYRGNNFINRTPFPVWLCTGFYNRKLYSVAEQYLFKLRDDENLTSELSGVQRSDTVGA